MTWTGEAPWAIPAAAVVVVLGGGLSLAIQVVVPAVVAVVVGILVAQFRHIIVTVDETHLRTAFAWPGITRVHIPLADIERLEYVPDLRPVRYGGWGYRGSLRLLKKAAVILRRGPGVIFALTGDRRYVVTVDDAETLADRAGPHRRMTEDAGAIARALATPSLVTAVVDDLTDPVLPEPGTDHRQAVADAGCFHVVEVGGQASETPPGSLRVVAANLERGRRLDDWQALLTGADPDVVLVSEVDGGMARSGNRYVARELADRLGMAFVFAVEFVELSLGGEEERSQLPPDARNEFGVHGGAILSRFPLDRPAAVRFEFDGHWYAGSSREPRVGGRMAVVATVGEVVVVAPHLESHGGPKGRARQLADLLDTIEPYAADRPVIVGGDLNTHTMDLEGRDADDGQEATATGAVDEPLTAERFRDPVARESLFAEATERGYGWSAANSTEPTHRTRRGRGDLHLDWFLTRGLVATDPDVLPAVDPEGNPLSDHDLIAVTVDHGRGQGIGAARSFS